MVEERLNSAVHERHLFPLGFRVRPFRGLFFLRGESIYSHDSVFQSPYVLSSFPRDLVQWFSEIRARRC